MTVPPPVRGSPRLSSHSGRPLVTSTSMRKTPRCDDGNADGGVVRARLPRQCGAQYLSVAFCDRALTERQREIPIFDPMRPVQGAGQGVRCRQVSWLEWPQAHGVGCGRRGLVCDLGAATFMPRLWWTQAHGRCGLDLSDSREQFISVAYGYLENVYLTAWIGVPILRASESFRGFSLTWIPEP